jgi:hypothetical protein
LLSSKDFSSHLFIYEEINLEIKKMLNLVESIQRLTN